MTNKKQKIIKDDISDKKDFLEFLEDNFKELKKEIAKISSDAIVFLTRQPYYIELYNDCNYQKFYGDLIKIWIDRNIKAKKNVYGQIGNFLIYLKKEPKNIPYVKKIELYIRIRRDNNIQLHDLAEILNFVFKNDPNEILDIINIIKEYILIVSNEELTGEIVLKEFQRVLEKDIWDRFCDNENKENKTNADKIKVAIIGGNIQEQNFKKIKQDPEFENDFKIDFWDAWRDWDKIPISNFKKYNIIILGENNHVWKDLPNNGTKGSLTNYLTSVEFTNDNKIKVFPSVKSLSLSRLRLLINEGKKQLNDGN